MHVTAEGAGKAHELQVRQLLRLVTLGVQRHALECTSAATAIIQHRPV